MSLIKAIAIVGVGLTVLITDASASYGVTWGDRWVVTYSDGGDLYISETLHQTLWSCKQAKYDLHWTKKFKGCKNLND